MIDDTAPTDHRPRPSLLGSDATEIIPAVVVTDVGDRRPVTCPECGSVQRVVLNRRESTDFCTTCDYPLFWTPNEVHRDTGDGADESLRRLPGTVGRATVASLTCWNCAEPNQVSAEVCVRCSVPLHRVAPPPPPPRPIPVPPPPPPPVYEEPERGTPWWAWVLLVVGLVAMFVIVVLAATGKI